MIHSRVVCVLSGGGAKATAHVGSIEALAERGIHPAHYVGTSMGAVMAACFASGLTYREVLKRVVGISRRDVAAFAPSAILGPFAAHLFQSDPLRKTIERIVPAESFDELEVPLSVTGVDADTGELVIFGAGGRQEVALADALYASCALPLYYPPARIGGQTFVDGGMRAVLPLDVGEMFDPDILFAVDVGPSLYAEPSNENPPLPAMLQAYGRAIRILMATQTEEAVTRCRRRDTPLVLVRPLREQDATFAIDAIVRFVEEGYRATHRAIDEWLSQGPESQDPATPQE